MKKKKRNQPSPELETPHKKLLQAQLLQKKNQKGPRRAVVILRLKEMSYENKLENYVRK